MSHTHIWRPWPTLPCHRRSGRIPCSRPETPEGKIAKHLTVFWWEKSEDGHAAGNSVVDGSNYLLPYLWMIARPVRLVIPVNMTQLLRYSKGNRSGDHRTNDMKTWDHRRNAVGVQTSGPRMVPGKGRMCSWFMTAWPVHCKKCMPQTKLESGSFDRCYWENTCQKFCSVRFPIPWICPSWVVFGWERVEQAGTVTTSAIRYRDAWGHVKWASTNRVCTSCMTGYCLVLCLVWTGLGWAGLVWIRCTGGLKLLDLGLFDIFDIWRAKWYGTGWDRSKTHEREDSAARVKLARYTWPLNLWTIYWGIQGVYEPQCGAISDVAYPAIHMVNAAPTKATLPQNALDHEQKTQGIYIPRDIWKGLKEGYVTLPPQSSLQIIWLSAHMLYNAWPKWTCSWK